MLLAVDVGNTHTVVGIFRDDRLIADWRMSSAGHRTSDECWLTIKSFCHTVDIPLREISGMGISSVVPDLTEIFAAMGRKYLRCKPTVVSSDLDLGIKIHYKDPSAVGADRLCNAIAGHKKYGGPLIVIDFGTATTYDVIAANGDYLGGVIAPGLETSAAELHRRAAKLPKVELDFPPRVIGNDTSASMQAGIMFGGVDAVEGLVRRIRAELGTQARVIATGGLATVVARHTKVIEACEPALVLEGVRLIYHRSNRR